MKWLDKIVDDTLKTPNGRWSRKSLTILVTFIFVLALGTFITIANKSVNIYGIQVFNSLLLFETALLGITEASKKLMNKTEATKDE